MVFIETLYWTTIVDKIADASSDVYLSLPSIDEELSELLVTVKRESNVKIKLCLDNSEDVIRNGYGETKGIDKLIENDIEIKESKGNRVSFIIIDKTGYVFFPESRIFTRDPSGPNAMELDASTTSRLIAYYFSPENVLEKEQLQERLEESFESQKQLLSQISNEVIHGDVIPVAQKFKIDAYAKAKEALIKIPPIEPDLQRQIKTYTTKVQFVELKFSGINLQSRTIDIPNDAIPINNAELKKLLQTKVKLFQNIEKAKGFEKLKYLKEKVEKLRKDFLTPITCREGKSLIKVEMKESFKAGIEEVKKETQEINKKMPDIFENAILETKDLIKAELLNFFGSNLPEPIKLYHDPGLKERKLLEFVDRIVFRIPFPKTEKLIEKISLNDYYYDLTFQDFTDDKFIQELKKKEILKEVDIKGIVEMKNAFAERR